MQTFDRGFQLGEARLGRFDDEQEFPCGLDTSLPAVRGLHGAGQDIRAGGGVLFNQGAGNFTGLFRRTAGDQDHDFVCHLELRCVFTSTPRIILNVV